MNKIFVVGPAWIGDMIMAQSLFKTLKRRDESAIIDVLAPSWTQALVERMPEVRSSYVMPLKHGQLGLATRYHIAKSIRSEGYTQAIVLPNSWKSALIPWLAKIPKRTGFLGEARFGLINDYRLVRNVPRMIDRFSALGYEKSESRGEPPYPHLDVNQQQVFSVCEKFAIDPMTDQPILALCPGAEFGSSKRWPVEYYAEVARDRLKQGWAVWIFGSLKESGLAGVIQEHVNQQCLDLTGRTTLSEAIDLLSMARVVVSNDSGLMHVAAALQKPVVAIYGSTDPGFTPPLGEAVTIMRLGIECSPCFRRECPLKHHQCMRHLYPDKVLSAIEAL